MRIFRCVTKILQGVSSEAANSHYGQQRVDVTEGKTGKKILGNNSCLISFELFLCYVKENGQQSNRRTEAIGSGAKWVGGFLNTPPLYCPSLSVASKC